MGIHANFNAGIINVLHKMQKNTAVITEFHSEKIHGKIVSELLKKENIYINPKPCKMLNKKNIGGWKTLLRDFLGIYYVIQAFSYKKKDTKNMLVFGLAYPFSLKIIFLCSLLLKKKVLVCLHGELSVFVKGGEFFRNKKYFSLMKSELIKKNDYLQYIVLGDPVYEVIKHIFLKKPIIINHPYIFSSKISLENNFNPLIIGQIGSGDKGKGTHYLFEIAKNMKKEIEEKKIKFVLIGKLSDTLLVLDEGLVEYQMEIIEQDKFVSLINDLHFTLQLRNNTAPQATASGSFLDTLKYNKPFFSFHNSFIDYYLKQIDMQNYTCNSIENLIDNLRWFLSLDYKKKKDEYDTMVCGIQQLKKLFSINYNAELLSNQL
jgi:glycosyltransferase involved in cell wall biosynthesis